MMMWFLALLLTRFFDVVDDEDASESENKEEGQPNFCVLDLYEKLLSLQFNTFDLEGIFLVQGKVPNGVSAAPQEYVLSMHKQWYSTGLLNQMQVNMSSRLL